MGLIFQAIFGEWMKELFQSGYLNGVDIVAVAIVVASVLVGVFRGLTGEAARLCGFGAGALAGYYTIGIWQGLAAAWIVWILPN